MRVSIVIPTYNAERWINKQLDMLFKQKCIFPFEVIIVDSSSIDRTLEIAKKYDVKILSIKKTEFNHGKTRTLAGKFSKGNILVYLTQDAIPTNEYTIKNLIDVFENDDIGAAYGRQVPYEDTNIFGKHLRIFNYKENSYIKSYNSKSELGIKSVFISNSFAAYKREALEKVGWFPETLFGEDQIVGANLLKAGYKIAYVANATVYHSHSYSVKEEFKRYYTIGKFHKNNKWLIDEFGKPEGEGISYIKSEISFLLKENPLKIPESIIRNILKYVGYKIGYFF